MPILPPLEVKKPEVFNIFFKVINKYAGFARFYLPENKNRLILLSHKIYSKLKSLNYEQN